MFVNFNEIYITVFGRIFFLQLECFYLLNYKIRGTLQERVYKTKIKDVRELWKRIVDEWHKLDQHIIINIIIIKKFNRYSKHRK